ncbi:MAG: DUF819 family protein [Bacteroidales bacterium]|nr:DUF819 family protein [Bacteroidales bacterium]
MRIGFVVAIYVLFPVLIAIAFQKWNWVQKVGSVIIAYAVGIVLSLSGATLFETGSSDATTMLAIQKWFMNVTVPLAIPLMLLSCDFRLWAHSLPKTIVVLIGGLVSVVIAVIVGYCVFRDSGIDDFSNLSAMMIGIYTGGTMNFAALGTALHVDSTIMTSLLTIEMLVTFPLIVFIVGGGFRLFRRLLPFKEKDLNAGADVAVAITDVENYDGMLRRETFPKTLIGFGLAIIFVAAAAGISLLVAGAFNEMIIILSVTTMAIVASFFEKIRAIPKTFELGMILILMFSIVVASQFDFYTLQSSAIILIEFVLLVLIVATTLHLLFCRFAKVEGDLFVVANIGLLCSPPFIPPVVGAMGNKKVLVSGLAIGLVGYAVGTYLGIALSLILE